MNAREAEAADISNNKYFNTIYRVYLPVNKKDPRQHLNPTHVLTALFNLYVQDAGKTYLYFFPGANHTHTSEVDVCLALIKDNKTPTGLLKVFEELNKIKNINPVGALEQLLGAFFSVFPQYLIHITNENLQVAIVQHQSKLLWEKPVETALKAWIETYRNKIDSANHEQLAEVSQAIGKNQADEYADFLLGQYKQNRPEARRGLFQGWVAAALGELTAKLSLAKRKAVTEFLWMQLDNHQAELTTIGLCEALSCLLTDTKQLKNIADRLYRYVLKEVPENIELFGDHQLDDNTISYYMPKIFTALVNLDAYLEPRMKSGITALFIEPNHIYPLRHGIHALWPWQTKVQNCELMARLTIHKNFVALAPIFISELSICNAEAEWPAFQQRYGQCLETAKRLLSNENTECANIVEQMQFVKNAEPPLPEQIRANILGSLYNKLTKYQESTATTELHIALHKALALGKDWCNVQGNTNIASMLCSIAKKSARNNEEVTTHAAITAVLFAEFLKPADMYALRDNLLKKLESPYRSKVAKALISFSHHVDVVYLPDLMTRLLTYPYPHAQISLATIHNQFQSPHEEELKSALKSVL